MQHASSTKLFAELNPMISTLLRQLCWCSGSCLKCEEPPKTDSCFISIWDTWRWRVNWNHGPNRVTRYLCRIGWTVTYVQEQGLQGRRRVKEWNKRKVIIWWGNGPVPNNNGQVPQVEEFGRQHWCINHLQNEYVVLGLVIQTGYDYCHMHVLLHSSNQSLNSIPQYPNLVQESQDMAYRMEAQHEHSRPHLDSACAISSFAIVLQVIILPFLQ